MKISSHHGSKIDLRSIFLGPKGENAEVFEKLLLEAYRDHVFWRRNFHPEDGFRVRESEKNLPEYEQSISRLKEELMGLLARLKGGVPFFSPRYIGHMTSDLTMASLIGYFATMLYNPNNVAVEGSPVTTSMELEVAEELAVMVGYDPESQWGHLTSGGTVANFEALWVARNVKYLPVALCWAAQELRLDHEICGLGLWKLLNFAPRAALDLKDEFHAAVGDLAVSKGALARHTLAALGYQEFGRRLQESFGDNLAPGVVLVPSTAHYSWEKISRSLGIGSSQVQHVPVNERFRMDPEALEEKLVELARRRQPVIACITVLGTTEESAVDRVDQIVEVRKRVEKDLGFRFYLHADAAWGGYAIAVTRGADGKRRSYEDALADYAPEPWPREGVFRALCAVEETDSVTVDPHKFGFVPYPAGAVSFRDRRVRDLVSVEAPYLFHEGASEGAYIGRFIMEGSKPGAAAAGVWMSHKVLPLDERGYGRLIGETSKSALALERRLNSGSWEPFRLVTLPSPDLNIVCFALSHEKVESLEEANAFAGRIYHAMSAGEGQDPRRLEYFVTQTILRKEEYGQAAVYLVKALGFTEEDYERAGGLTVIRCTVMNPFLAHQEEGVDFLGGFAKELRKVMEREWG